jgi:hypothetical protein
MPNWKSWWCLLLVSSLLAYCGTTAPKWAQQMSDHVAARGRSLEKLYFGYTTCPKCAKAYGKNYVVLFAKVKESGAAAARA